MTTETKTRVKKPSAEVVGSFAEVLKRGECDDGRDLYEFWASGTVIPVLDWKIYVLAKSELDSWKALRSKLGTMERLTKARIAERTRMYALELMEEQNAETKTEASE